jgi:membrane protein YqaA with SNARE-associated domain
MIDFLLGIFSEMFQMNMRDHHDMPFAMPLMMACLVGGLVGFIIVKFVVKEQHDDSEKRQVH